MIAREVDLLSEEAAKELLAELIQKLDDLDEEEYFGRFGWRHILRIED